MAKLIEVHPLILPPDYLELRKPRYNQRNRNKGPLESFDLMQFDRRTVFYDVFFSQNGSKLLAIGPPFNNLDNRLKQLELTINGAKAKFRFKTLPRELICLEAKLYAPIKEINTVHISFENYNWSRDIAFFRASQNISLALTTMQRDNRIHWILDWINYYKKALEVEQFIIYDNRSAYQEKVIDLLPDNVLVVPWNSPFGPTDSHLNKFLHIGQLNHCRLRFEEVDIFLNFDIDELLVIRNKRVKEFIHHFPSVSFKGYRVPYIDMNKEKYSFSDFTKRAPEPQSGAPKYSFQRMAISANAVHKVIVGGVFARAFPSLFIKEVLVNQAYFLHYLAINTDWKAKTSRLGRLSCFRPRYETNTLVSDESVMHILNGE